MTKLSDKMKCGTGILPVKLGQDAQATKEKIILLETLNYAKQSQFAGYANECKLC